jgi:arylsulfatase A-like enzyme
MRDLGLRTALVGKTHMKADDEGMARLGIDANSTIGVRLAECGFDPYDRDDGLHPEGPAGKYDPSEVHYDNYLREHGFGGDNPWEEWANSAQDEQGKLLSGWFMSNAGKPARIPEEHSETAYMTNRAMDFIREAGDEPWCLHLSYIKPHWPYIASAPYHNMFGPDEVLPATREESERENPHPLYAGFMRHKVGEAFARQGVREAVIPTYMGLIKQIDDHLGRLFGFLEEAGRLDDTLIVFTADHGDYLGDHWLGEKDLFHEPSVKIPFIVVDPGPAADKTRGTAIDALVESIDLIPTFIRALDATPAAERLEGRALQPWLHGEPPQQWRKFAISEYDYSMLGAGALRDRPSDCLIYMATDGRWKYIEPLGFDPILFDLDTDPCEYEDVAGDPDNAEVLKRLRGAIDAWARRPSQRTTISDTAILARRGARPGAGAASKGILIGYWDESELPDNVAATLRSRGLIQ